MHINAELVATQGFLGNFSSTIAYGDRQEVIEVCHGATVVCVGGVEYRGDEYAYGTDRGSPPSSNLRVFSVPLRRASKASRGSRRRPTDPGWVGRAKRAVPEESSAFPMPSSVAAFRRTRRQGSETPYYPTRS